jgi:hypothetical integral membrane protein (TIGR02206 family)
MQGAPFELLSPAHVLTLVAIGATAAALVVAVRRWRGAERAIRIALAAVLAAATAVYFAVLLPRGWTVWHVLPFHLCDFLILVAAVALLTGRPLACELLYFWGCSGTALAMVTPDVLHAWPAAEFISYFTLHGAVVVSALVMTAWRVPRRGAPWRAWVALNLYAAAVGAIDLASGENFLFLRARPPSATPLDWMGPWPVYILVADAIALGLFLALDLPWRHRRAAHHSAASTSG